MQSIRSKMIIGLIRNRHIFRGKLKPEIIDEDFCVKEFRDQVTKASQKTFKKPEDITITRVDIDGMNGEWIIPEKAPDDKVLLYIHGGGFISGDCVSHRGHVIKFAKGSNRRTLLFDYRLAPEHPYPAALEDSIKAYKWLLDLGYKPENIVMGGESAGGTLTLTTLLALKRDQLPFPARVFSISPATDLTCKASSFEYNAKKDIAPINSWSVWTQFYVGAHDVNSPYISPLNGDLAGLPPMLLCVGTNEIYLDDTRDFAKKAEQSGVEVTFDLCDKMIHAFPILSPMFPEAKKEMEKICNYICK